jgi:formylglycine-generating enzyme required for sulfatase activity
MKRWFPPAVIAIAVVAVCGLIAVSWRYKSERAEQLRFERGETELVLSNLARVPVQLFKAGNYFGDARPVASFNGERVWLPAGDYRPNRYGIYHLSGNVVEWTNSVARPFNRERPYVDAERNREDVNEARVARGGSWYSASIALLYIPYRDSFQPEVSHHDLGFRIVARSLP